MMNRRSMLAAIGAAAAAPWRPEDAVAQDRNPAGQVEDRAASLRISALHATPVNRKVYVKIETAGGPSGWGIARCRSSASPQASTPRRRPRTS